MDNRIIAGVDDATKCPCIGSIFISGVTADLQTIKSWKDLGVKDSKLLTRKKRDALDKVIRQSALSFRVDHITPAIIDDKTLNLNEWEMVYCLRIIRKIHVAGLEDIHVDNWEVSEALFQKRLESVLAKGRVRLDRAWLNSLNLLAEHRADENHTIVGAASILSRAASDRQYDRYRKKYGDFGSGSPGDPQTRLFVWKHRADPPPIIRTSWQTYKHLAGLESIEDDTICRRDLLKKTVPGKPR